MDPEEREQLKRWVENWKTVGPELEAIRREEVRTADNREAIAALDCVIDFARRPPPRPSSGIVEMQKHFAKLRR